MNCFLIVQLHVCIHLIVQPHLSNRERKEMAKKERKQRRADEKRNEKKTEEVFDPIGSLAI